MPVAVVHAGHPADDFKVLGKALGLALLVHVLLLGLVVLNWSRTSVDHVPVNIIQARVITEELPEAKSPKAKSLAIDIEREKARKRKQENAKRKADRLKKQKAAKRRAIAKRKAAATRRHKQADRKSVV